MNTKNRQKKKMLSSVANYNYRSQKRESFSKEVLTIPNRAFSIRELYARHTIPEGMYMTGYYDENPSHDDDVSFRTPGYDLSDMDQHSETIKKVREAQEKEAKEKQKQQEKELLTKEILAELKEKQSEQKTVSEAIGKSEESE